MASMIPRPMTAPAKALQVMLQMRDSPGGPAVIPTMRPAITAAAIWYPGSASATIKSEARRSPPAMEARTPVMTSPARRENQYADVALCSSTVRDLPAAAAPISPPSEWRQQQQQQQPQAATVDGRRRRSGGCTRTAIRLSLRRASGPTARDGLDLGPGFQALGSPAAGQAICRRILPDPRERRRR